MDILPAILVLGSSLWVLFDARSIGVQKGKIRGFFNMSPMGWFLSCVLCWIVAFPAYLVKRREYLRVPPTPTPTPTSVPPPVVQGSDLMSQLSSLADLHSQGLLTDEEFQTKKKQLVHRMMDEPTV